MTYSATDGALLTVLWVFGFFLGQVYGVACLRRSPVGILFTLSMFVFGVLAIWYTIL